MKDKLTTIRNEQTGQEVILKETNNLTLLNNQLNLLALNGLGYSPWARDIQDKIKKLKEMNKLTRSKK